MPRAINHKASLKANLDFKLEGLSLANESVQFQIEADFGTPLAPANPIILTLVIANQNGQRTDVDLNECLPLAAFPIGAVDLKSFAEESTTFVEACERAIGALITATAKLIITLEPQELDVAGTEDVPDADEEDLDPVTVAQIQEVTLNAMAGSLRTQPVAFELTLDGFRTIGELPFEKLSQFFVPNLPEQEELQD